ncbi:uncharacterized protein LOC123509425 [Portunus trituberculatus]|uniref:uncharacterized protein LOC123509425 n=1 Tax=Portunus trituberculatus TaxID=210409 RepID=UPI001E1CEF70|nr:uncharacterized protein LOC123509425 [Portunus trituberculatus]
MNRFGEVVSAVSEGRRHGPLSRRVVNASRLQELLHYLAGTTSKAMGNQQAAPASTLQQGRTPGVTSSSGFQWSSGPQVTIAKDTPPECLIKLAKILVCKSLAEENVDGITRSVFIKYITKSSEPLGKRLFQYLMKHWQKEAGGSRTTSERHQCAVDKGDVLSSNAFTAAASHLMALHTDSQQMEFYIKLYAGDQEKISKGDVFDLISAAHQVSTCSQRTCCLPDDILMAVVRGAMHGKESINTKYLHSWLCQHCSRLLMWLHRNIMHTLTVGHRTIPDNTEEAEDDRDTPILDCPGKSTCVSLHPALIWLLTCSLPLLYTKPEKSKPHPSNNLLLDPHVFIDKMVLAVSPTHWVPLYNSDEHGLSINRLQHHVFGYHGATLMFITTEGDNMFCVASDQEWRDSKHFWGGEHARCLHLTPEYKIIESGAKILYFNVTSRGFPTGLQVGTDSTNRALTLDLNLTLVTYRKIPYKLQSVEVWGCSTSEVKEAQQELKKREVKDVESRRKVKVNSSDWLDNPDRYLIELAGTRLSYAQYDNPPPEASGSK